MSSDMILLRPHHGMCLAFFVGYGYSDSFSAHMSALLDSLTPDTLIQLTVDTDAVCSACPNNLDGVCKTAQLVADYDRAVLSLCGLQDGQIIAFGRFAELVQTCVLSPDLRPTICGGCHWDGICGKQVSRWV